MPDPIHAAAESFELPIGFALLAFFTFGVTGALAGLRRGYDLVGVVALALITAGGGGLIRDGLLISQGPASIVTYQPYVLVVLAAAILTCIFHRFVHHLNRLIAVVDALGLGSFAVYGVQRSLEAGLSTTAAILGGTLTVVGGGLLRDVIVREEPLLFKPGQFYALVAIGGCCLYVALIRWSGLAPEDSAKITIVVVAVLRLLAIHFNWQTSAVFRRPSEPQAS